MGEAVAEPHVGGATHTVGIIGWPVAHSLSPAIHNAAFRALDLDWIYVPLPVRFEHVPAAIAGLEALGFAGANVTMPHKTAAAELIDDPSEDARTLGAVNTIVVRDGVLRGENTDAPGFERFLRDDAAFEPAGRTALVYGSGGAARACALALVRGGLASLAVAVRDPVRARALLRVTEPFPTEVAVVPLADAAGSDADLVVNATPIGDDGRSVLPEPAYRPGMLVVDLLYQPAATPLFTRARAAGATAFGGLGLLLHQAALSFELWTGQRPPLDVMSAAALAALAERG
ncbi:MAG: shikimate dehydrogenase [Actinomycetota bacterium]